ncbi:MAG: hypothetical protein K2X77_29005 [Candidatus Obscuribacterales bacterium]|nr:hypothetical protein [Candidatus Obscuribacterales bacterium]
MILVFSKIEAGKMPALPGSNRTSRHVHEREDYERLEAGKMPALPGSNRTSRHVHEREDYERLEAGKMPALPGSNRTSRHVHEREDYSRKIRSRQDAGAPGIEPNVKASSRKRGLLSKD